MSNQCESYPCHKNLEDGFDCKNCFCPIYHLDCSVYGGTPRWDNADGNFKDCSCCTLPHYSKFDILVSNSEMKKYFQ
ncbi:MAG TPA: hypothetical protein DCS19_04905 [Flavobacterium sp.]|nr:hypothetical protein [Flavobacterium sp.]